MKTKKSGGRLRPPLTDGKGVSLIIDSGDCSAEWLAKTLDIPWFGDVAVVYRSSTHDIMIIQYDASGRRKERYLS